MIWLLFAAAAGVAAWAFIAMRSGALDRRRGQPLLWGAGVTAAALLALMVHEQIQQERMMNQIVGAGAGLFARGMSDHDARADEMGAERERIQRDFEKRQADFDRNFRARQDAFDRSFKEQADRFDRASDERRAGLGAPASVSATNTGEVR